MGALLRRVCSVSASSCPPRSATYGTLRPRQLSAPARSKQAKPLPLSRDRAVGCAFIPTADSGASLSDAGGVWRRAPCSWGPGAGWRAVRGTLCSTARASPTDRPCKRTAVHSAAPPRTTLGASTHPGFHHACTFSSRASSEAWLPGAVSAWTSCGAQRGEVGWEWRQHARRHVPVQAQGWRA